MRVTSFESSHFCGVFAIVAAIAFATIGCASTQPPLPPRALLLNHDGAAAFAMGDLSTAATRFELALEYSPSFTEAWVNLGLVELRRGNLEQAERDLKKARSLNPNMPTPHHALGLLEDARNAKTEAEDHYRDALKVDPGFTPARINLARILLWRHAYDDAREQYARLIEVDPDRAEGWLGLIESLFRLDRQEESERALVDAYVRFGDLPALCVYRARQELRRNAFADAEATLAPMTASDDPAERVTAWGWTALARIGQGDLEGGKKAAGEALTISNTDTVASYAMASALYIGGDEKTARGWFDRTAYLSEGRELNAVMSDVIDRERSRGNAAALTKR